MSNYYLVCKYDWFELWTIASRLPRWESALLWEEFCKQNDVPISSKPQQREAFFKWYVKLQDQKQKAKKLKREIQLKTADEIIAAINRKVKRKRLDSFTAARVIKHIESLTQLPERMD